MSWSSRGLASVLLLALFVPVPAAAQPAVDQASPPAARRGVLGYYVPYDPSSWASLQEHARAIDAVGAQWVTIDACGNLASRDDQTLKQFARANGIAVFPSLLTGSGWLNHQLLSDGAVAAHAIDQIVEYVTSDGYDGLDLDLEAVEPRDRPAYTAFVAALGAALHESDKGLAPALPAERYQVPIALDPATQSATFRYQAPAGDPPPPAQPVPPPQHEITVREPPPCPVAVPPPPPTPTPRPIPDPNAIQDHEVWLEESASAAARLGLADRYRAGGVATWRLGLEDPRVWALLQQWRGSR